MKTAILLGIVSIGLVLAHVSSSGLERNEEELLVEKVIQESTKQYDERMKAAFLNGAQSKKNHRELKKSNKYSQKIGRISSIYLDAFKELINTYKIDRTTALTHLRQELPEECELEELGCDPTAKYRSYRGTCNNLDNPYWGSVNMPNLRLIPPAYTNLDEPRGGLVSSLPAARDITLRIHRDSSEGENFEESATHMVPQFGQFLDHDITLTPVDNLACCGEGPRSEGCWPIDVNSTDPFYREGRDHGTPSYNSFRVFCNLTPLTDWDNRPAEISQKAWDRLREVYAVPEDIDLYTGGLSQTPVQGGLSGPTFVCIQALQFESLMKGDRFFFTHGGQSGSFTPKQLAALRSRTLGDIICQNSALKETARNVFQSFKETENPMVSCTDDSRQLDISLFAEESVAPTTTPASSGTALSFTITGVALCIVTVVSCLLF